MKKIMLFFLAVAAFIITGCATGAVSTKMVPPEYAIQKRHPHLIAVQTSGGKETNPMLMPQVSDESFKEALIESINKSGTFRGIVPADRADCMLEVDIIDLAQPWGGLDMTVTMHTRWKLTDMKDKRVVFQENVSKSYTAVFTDAFAGTERMQLANEGAARENIREGLKKLSQLNITTEAKDTPAAPAALASVAAVPAKKKAIRSAEETAEDEDKEEDEEQILPAEEDRTTASGESKAEPIPQNIEPSGYTLEYNPMIVNLKKGDFAAAFAEADSLHRRYQHPDGVKQNKYLSLLERGRVALTAGMFEQAIADLQEAEKRFLTIEGTISLTEGFGSILTDDTAMEYEAEMHEKLMISPYLVMAYLNKGDFSGAVVERNRTITKINQYIEEKPVERAYLENPFARYLTALMYEMEDKKDDAKIEYKKLKKEQDIARLDGQTAKTTDLVILVDVGLAPQKFQRKWGPAPIPGVGVVGFAYAEYAPTPTAVTTADIHLNEKLIGSAELLYDLENTVLTQYEKNKPDIQAKITARMTAKAATQFAAKMAAKEVLKNIPFASLFSDIAIDAAGAAWIAAEQADLRGWLSLPKQIRHLRINALEPGEYAIKIDYGCGTETKNVRVEKDRINIAYFAYPK